MEYQAYLLRSIADQIKLASLSQVALQPGISSVYRLTIRYHDRRAHDSVGTAWRFGKTQPVLEMVYRELFNHKAMTYALDSQRYEAFALALQKLRFDQLKDQPNLPTYGTDLWLLERAAGSFTKSLILAPTLATDTYATLIALVREHLPELLREVKT
ncbi:MAG TPA: hypothetical protein VHO69_04725 [Phototrophicaceae bacterium]|nr:hypothetical protein [Phototrophicaceae bacterium]